jgi:polyphosphate glucokinase
MATLNEPDLPVPTPAADSAAGPVFTIDANQSLPIAPPVPDQTAESPSTDVQPPPEKIPSTPTEGVLQQEAIAETPPAKSEVAPASILAIDIGGTKVKILATGQTEPRKAATGKSFTPAKLIETVRTLAEGWEYEAITIGYPGMVGSNGPRSEPGNLGGGWVGFDFASAFSKPVKMFNDAAMQALGSYEGGRMLFLGLGTGLGSALITGHVVIPLELGQLPFDGTRTLGEVLGRRGLAEAGRKEWRLSVEKAVASLMRAFVTDYVVIGGGNAKEVKNLLPGMRRGHNLTAFRGGFRLWSVEDVWVLAASGGETDHPSAKESLRLL